jgi:hypothetical protein
MRPAKPLSLSVCSYFRLRSSPDAPFISFLKGINMKLFSAAVPVSNKVRTVDAIEYAGTLWLVTHWVDSPDESMTMPARLVCLSLLPYQKTEGSLHDYVLNKPLPKEIFDLDAPPPEGIGLVVLDTMKVQMSRNRRAN